jgi:glycosyltransferase involved in cell wall biosynthesis
MMRAVRIVAMLQVYNEHRFIARCIEHLHQHGVHVYVVDNESTDDTLAIAESYTGRGVIGIETLARGDSFSLLAQCARQEELAQTLDADWLIHHDADEFRVSPKRGQSLADALAEIDAAGFNAVNFLEFAFTPTRESPDHDHPDFQETMLWYYPFLPWSPHRLNAWKRRDGPVDLTTRHGHEVRFPGLKVAPQSLYMRHYLYLSLEHVREKFVERQYARNEVESGFHGWRARVRPEHLELPSEREFPGLYEGDDLLDPSNPFKRHLLQERVSPKPRTSHSKFRMLRGRTR